MTCNRACDPHNNHNPPDRPRAGTKVEFGSGKSRRYQFDLASELFISMTKAISALVDRRRSIMNCFFRGPSVPRQFQARIFIHVLEATHVAPPTLFFLLTCTVCGSSNSMTWLSPPVVCRMSSLWFNNSLLFVIRVVLALEFFGLSFSSFVISSFRLRSFL